MTALDGYDLSCIDLAGIITYLGMGRTQASRDISNVFEVQEICLPSGRLHCLTTLLLRQDACHYQVDDAWDKFAKLSAGSKGLEELVAVVDSLDRLKLSWSTLG